MKAVRAVATALAIIIVAVLVLEAALHWTKRRLPSDRSTAGSTQEHMPPRQQGLIHGTKADDVIEGTDAGERIAALVGRDRIVGRGGDDVLDGGGDADVLMGGEGDDTYVVQHHGGGADVILETDGTDTLQLVGGHLALASIQILRHGDDLLLRWNQERPADAVLIRSWFADTRYHIERLQLPDGTVVTLEPLAARAPQASSEDLIHFRPTQ